MKNFIRIFLPIFCMTICSFSEARPKLPKDAIPLPIVNQETDYSCGAAALLSLLKYWQDYGGEESELYDLLKTSETEGTHPKNIVLGAKSFGLYAKFYENIQIDFLKDLLNKGFTVIVDIQAFSFDALKIETEGAGMASDEGWWNQWEDGHYVNLIGMDKKYAYFQDPSTEKFYTYMALDELLARWHDYETVNGEIRRYYHSAIAIRGAHVPKKSLPTKRIVRQR